MATFPLKLHDTKPSLVVALLNADLSAFNLTGTTEWFLHILRADGMTVVSRPMVKHGTDAEGLLRYDWVASDWTSDLVVGEHLMEYEVIDNGGGRMTFPNGKEVFDTLSVGRDIADGS